MEPSLVLDPCPCGTTRSFGRCCGPILSGQAPAETAEQLMRSRYSAFARGDHAYLLHSWHPQTRPMTVELVGERQWQSLEVVATTDGQIGDATGTVRFVASFRDQGVDGFIDELSRFERHDARWVYVSGVPSPMSG